MTAFLFIVAMAATGIAICAVAIGYAALTQAAELRSTLAVLDRHFDALQDEHEALAARTGRAEQDWAREIRNAIDEIRAMLGLARPERPRPVLIVSNDRSPEHSA